ncbi:nicotinate (nicotinamide) nucleotide adenylyltransferase [Coraliomargarita algicola]|uniref:Probable nicotinate-nucleotide adenylyltransferase n=1 Tax=Coraliomargarita algicola TaxID=3092156 RepID=A0ABZ0RNR4_9BACT|nr:nicotinate (nicotinamide) nucleotide adenylyltransferase [Coraliomargarita sp. J2-16]WPJ96395.1 nicotinate (nicotinamide) nucleotide adenylyltransferase [Coraliomargarita sp. J2-16]
MKPTELSSPLKAVALYGGSFDPVHCAHLHVARSALEHLQLDQVIFIPAAQSPLKTNTTTASDAQRIEMLRLATAEESRFAVDTSEIERGGTSYTIDTVRAFCSKQPDTQLYWIIGADQFELLPKWHQIEEIARRLTFAVLRRPGHTIATSAVPGLKYIAIEAPLMAHSSSGIRVRLAAGRTTEDLLPASVEAFISSHGLYTQ